MKEIMMRAWAIYRTLTTGTHREKLSAALKAAWAEANTASGKQAYINRLNTILAHSETYEYYSLEAVVTDWAKGKHNRTYFSIVEKSASGTSKHCVKKDYGYYDNNTDEYIPARGGNLDKDFTFSGARF